MTAWLVDTGLARLGRFGFSIARLRLVAGASLRLVAGASLAASRRPRRPLMARTPTTRDDAPAYLLRYEARRVEPRPDRRPGPAGVRRQGPPARHPPGPRRARPGRRAAGAHRGLRPRDRRSAGAAVAGVAAAARWPTATDVRLIRHGQTQGYIADSALTPLGRWQAHRKGQDLAKGMQDGSWPASCTPPTARAAETAYGAGRGAAPGGGPVRHRRRDDRGSGAGRRASGTSRCGSTAGSSTSPPPSRSSPTCSRATSATAVATGPGWMVEMDRVFRIQFAGGDPITYWLTHADALRRAARVRRAPLLGGHRRRGRATRRPARGCSCARTPARSGPWPRPRSVTTPASRNNVEDVRIRVHATSSTPPSPTGGGVWRSTCRRRSRRPGPADAPVSGRRSGETRVTNDTASGRRLHVVDT